ncbi:MAG: hypothetical protein NVS2B3_15910 [Vulcanimicrobiaceae bacterium]
MLYRLANGMRFLGGSRVAALSSQTAITLMLVVGFLAVFLVATYLSYYGSVEIRNAFAYQSAVVAVQRDAEFLELEQVDRHATPAQLRPYEKLLESDLANMDGFARDPDQRAPAFALPPKASAYEALTAALATRQRLGADRFAQAVGKNARTRDLSNALFAIVALVFVILVTRLRRRIEEGRALVERLQRAFIARRRTIENVEIGSVLLSATRGSSVGGDTHDAFTFDGRYAMFLIADVSGKGIDAAVDTALIKYSVRTFFSEEGDPGVVLSKFARLYAAGAENPETFVVMFLAVLELETGTLRYASAGHEPAWVLLGQDVAGLAPTGSIVGIETEPAYATHVVHLRPGDALVVSTDGLTESRDGRGDLLGASAVATWISTLDGDAQAMADGIVKRLRRRSSRITDDLAILVVRYAPKQRASVARVVPDIDPPLAMLES